MPFREITDTDFRTKNLGFGIDITTKCNLNCMTCYFLDSQKTVTDTHISFEYFKKAMQKASLAGFQEIYILGGEPTLHPNIINLLKCAVGFGFKQVLLVTNGMLLANDLFCRKVADSGADIVVQRHVIGNGEIQKNIQDIVVGRKNTLDQVNQAFINIELFFKPHRVAIQCCITRPVVESGQIYEVFRYARKNGYEHVLECTKASERFQRGNHLDISSVELLHVYEKLQRIDIDEFDGKSNPLTPQAYGKTCHMPENSVHCLLDGTIVPCVGQPFPLGNIFNGADTSLENILSSKKRDFFMNPNKRIHGHCRQCSYFQICTGGCRGDAFFLTGCFNASAVQCPQLAKYEKLSLRDFIPSTCDNCEFNKNSFCSLRENIDKKLVHYFGTVYQENR